MASNQSPNDTITVNPPTRSSTAADYAYRAAARPGVSSPTTTPAPGFGTTSGATRARGDSLAAILEIPPPLPQQRASPYAGGAAATMARHGLAVALKSPSSKGHLSVGNLARVAAASYVSEEKKMSRIMEWVDKVEDEIL